MRKLILLSLFLFIFMNLIQAQEIDKTNPVKDVFDMDLEELLNIKTTIASKKAQTLAEAPSVVSVISADEIKKMGANDMNDILNQIPGFEATVSTSGFNLFGVRGVKDPRFNCKVLVLLDGRPINDIVYGTAFEYKYQIDVENIERIEIIRGPGSALYGRNAFSSVINIISKTGKTEKGIRAKAELGNFNTINARIAYGYSKNDLNFHLSGNLVKTDDTNATDPNTKSKLILEQDVKIINASLEYKGLKFNAAYRNQQFGKLSEGQEARENVGYYALEYNKEINSSFNLKAKVWGQNNHHVEDLQIVAPDPSKSFLGIFVMPTFTEYSYAAQVEASIKLADNNDLLIGAQADLLGISNGDIFANIPLGPYSTPSDYAGLGHNNQKLWNPGWIDKSGWENSNIALYLQDSWQVLPNLGLTIGARYDNEKRIGGQFNPRAGVVFKLNPKSYLKVMYGSAYRSPCISQQFQLAGYSLGNPDLKPEKIKTFEVSYSYQFKHFATQVNIYRNNTTDEIYAQRYVTADVANTPKNTNLGSNIAFGLEWENKFVISGGFTGYLNFSYTKSDNNDLFSDGIERTYSSPDVSPVKINAGTNLRFLKYFNLNANANYRSEASKYFTYDPKTSTYNYFSQDKVGDYTIFNATLRCTGLINHVELNASCFNLFDTKYYSQGTTAHVAEQGPRQFIARLILSL